MTTYYVRSTDGSDGDSGLTWALAKATLAGALAVAVAGDRIWVSQAHEETQASTLILTSAGTAAAPVEVLCGNDAAEPPTALATTATIAATGTSNIVIDGHVYIYGISFIAGSGSSTAAVLLVSTATVPGQQVLESCVLHVNTTSTNVASRIGIGNASTSLVDQVAILVNCALVFGGTSQEITPRSRFIMRGGTVAATGSVPDALVLTQVGSSTNARFIGVDLSACSGALVAVTAGQGAVRFEQCKVHASVTLTTGTNPGGGGVSVLLDNCDSGDTQTRMQRHQYEGDVYSETTIVRTGGASNGTTPLAHKMVSSASRTFSTPLVGPEMVRWNDVVGSAQTVTVEIVHDSVTNLKDNEVWLEVEYLGTSGFPLSLFASDRMTDIIATPADQATSTVAWTTTGITNVNKQKLEVTFTPQEIGIIRARVVLAKPSYTVYADPLLTVA